MNRVAVLFILSLPATALAHDSWVQTNVNLIRVGDAVHVDLMLGNHGNEHRDFKLAGKVALESSTLEVTGPDGKRFDLKDRLSDTGYTPQEGFWTTRFEPTAPGLYIIGHTFDRVMTYAPERAIKSAKACFVASPELDKVAEQNPGFDRPLGHALELVPVVNPVTPMGPGTKFEVRLLYKGKPLARERVSFIPRGATLKNELDERYERTTDELARPASSRMRPTIISSPRTRPSPRRGAHSTASRICLPNLARPWSYLSPGFARAVAAEPGVAFQTRPSTIRCGDRGCGDHFSKATLRATHSFSHPDQTGKPPAAGGGSGCVPGRGATGLGCARVVGSRFRRRASPLQVRHELPGRIVLLRTPTGTIPAGGPRAGAALSRFGYRALHGQLCPVRKSPSCPRHDPAAR